MAIAVFIGVVVLYCGAPFGGMGASSRVIAVGQLLLLAGCVAVGVVFVRHYDRGLGLGLIIGAALMALCGPLGGLGGCVSVFGG
jgi:hypothetical protein